MKALAPPRPTPEQALIIDDDDPGFWLIRGAAGSGKTTTALLRLRFLVPYWLERHRDLGLPGPVRVLVLTFNRTLRGYVDRLAREEAYASSDDIELDVTTFSSWAQRLLGQDVLEHGPRNAVLNRLAAGSFGWQPGFLHDEVTYALGRFMPADRREYLTRQRTARGRTPQVGQQARRRLLDEVIEPYTRWKVEQQVVDWNDVAVTLADRRHTAPYDVVVVDETQDFSANQIRAIVNHLAEEFVCTFIRDNTQRIYPNSFLWREVGVQFDALHSRRLQVNYRNSREIAVFARPLVENLDAVDEQTLPDFSRCQRPGPLPWVLRGSYPDQLDWTIRYLRSEEVTDEHTVAYLHPKGWFRDLRPRLDAEGIAWTSLTREARWPPGDERVALCTMHSAKGLEFDHVIIIGYDAALVTHGDEDDDSLRDAHRRLLAMAVGRARHGVVVGFNPADAPSIADLLDAGSYRRVDL